MFCIPAPPLFTYYSGAFGETHCSLGTFHAKNAIMKFTFMTSVYFMWAASYSVGDLILPPELQTLMDDGCLLANQNVLARTDQDEAKCFKTRVISHHQR